jgi:hypothetical protein
VGVTQRSAHTTTHRGSATCGTQTNGQGQGSGLAVANFTNYRIVNGNVNNGTNFYVCNLSEWCGSNASAWVVLYAR